MSESAEPAHVSAFVAIPADDGHRVCFWKSLINVLLRGTKHRLHFAIVPGDSLISRARNNLAAEFLTDSTCDYLVFIDTDLDFRSEDLDRLLSHRLPLVAGLYAMKTPDLRWVVNSLPGQPFVDEQLQEVLFTATGFQVIHRSVLERMRDAFPEIAYRDDATHATKWDFFSVGVVRDPVLFPHGPRYLSEDWYFCYRARQLGIPVMLDAAVKLLHEGWATYPLAATRSPAAS